MTKTALQLIIYGVPISLALFLLIGIALAWFGIGGNRLGRILLWTIIGIICAACIGTALFYLIGYLAVSANPYW